MTKNQIWLLDELFRQAIRKRDGKRCQYCIYHNGTEVHHYFTRSRRSTRWDMRNGVLLCWRCHKYAHNHRKSFREQMLNETDLIELERKANTPAKLDYDEVKKYLGKYL